jgi:hypothetical protein
MFEPTPQGSASSAPAASAGASVVTAKPSPMTKLDHALDVVRRGCRVIPLSPDRQKPRRNVVCHHETDACHHWENYPDDDIAISTNGYVVVVIRRYGCDTFKELSQSEEWPKTTRGQTSDGRCLVVYKSPPGISVQGGRGLLGCGVDVLSYGDWIAAPYLAVIRRAILTP